MTPTKILLCAANPEVKNLQLAAEHREIEERVARAERDVQKQTPIPHASSFQFVVSPSTRSRDLLRLLQLHTPQVLHISGHGAQGGELLLDGVESPFSAKDSRTIMDKRILGDVVGEFSSTLRLVFLNVCYSVTESSALTERIDCLIAMNGTVEDPVALTFAATFYEQCALGSSVAKAFRLAQVEVSSQSGNYALSQVPQLRMRAGLDPEKYQLVKPPITPSSPRPSSEGAAVRRLIGQRLPFDPSLHAFLIAYYPQVARQCGSDMQRTVKLNLLLSLERDMNRLRQHVESFCEESADEA